MRTSALRAARLLAIPASAVGLEAVGLLRRLGGAPAADVRQQLRTAHAQRTRRSLGQLKGGALKAGQLLSTVEALFPEDPESTWRHELVALQENNPPVAFADIQKVLRDELGRDWRAEFESFAEEPVAAASLGQVHRARMHGREVAVKVQYPGIADAVAADVRMLAVALRLAGLVAPGLAMPPLVAELRTRLAEELDYRHEGSTQQRFADAYAGDTGVAVPQVRLALDRVLVTDWLDGEPLVRVTPGSPAADAAGIAYQRFFLESPARVGLLHTDPHPGNFRWTADRRLGVFDFGSALSMPGGLPDTFGRLIRVLQGADGDAVLDGLHAGGFLRPGRTVEVDKLIDYLSPFTEPSRHETFTYSRQWLRSQFARVNDPRNPEFAVALQLNLPAEHLFTHRVWLGIVGVLCQLNATVPVAAELREWLPGFADEAATKD